MKPNHSFAVIRFLKTLLVVYLLLHDNDVKSIYGKIFCKKAAFVRLLWLSGWESHHKAVSQNWEYLFLPRLILDERFFLISGGWELANGTEFLLKLLLLVKLFHRILIIIGWNISTGLVLENSKFNCKNKILKYFQFRWLLFLFFGLRTFLPKI